jgi:hypothetical protein
MVARESYAGHWESRGRAYDRVHLVRVHPTAACEHRMTRGGDHVVTAMAPATGIQVRPHTCIACSKG